jgi:hypothetical protein
MPRHRGSGRGPHAVEHASHLDARDAAAAVARRRDRLEARQRAEFNATRAAEIDMLAAVFRLYRGFADWRDGEAKPGNPSLPGGTCTP